uniref:B box-type domain-containing protein n=1 Tax=Gorilla gorilla gorilla TaxID=9595 RepID=G3R1B8_GORGO
MAGAAAGSRTPGRSELVEGCGWRCPEHGDRVAELFCRRCRRCVCALCPVLGAHRGHPVGLALEAAVHVQGLEYRPGARSCPEASGIHGHRAGDAAADEPRGAVPSRAPLL